MSCKMKKFSLPLVERDLSQGTVCIDSGERYISQYIARARRFVSTATEDVLKKTLSTEDIGVVINGFTDEGPFSRLVDIKNEGLTIVLELLKDVPDACLEQGEKVSLRFLQEGYYRSEILEDDSYFEVFKLNNGSFVAQKRENYEGKFA